MAERIKAAIQNAKVERLLGTWVLRAHFSGEGCAVKITELSRTFDKLIEFVLPEW